MQQALQGEIGTLADQLKIDTIGLADGFAPGKRENLQVVLDAIDSEAEMGVISGVEHDASLFCCHPWARPNQRCRRLGAGRRNISNSWVTLALR